ncbi:NAD(P)/FAD-dependent oxidoreductase [Streptomyces sp. NPDC090127]|uniref:NAD(P)/FAD-dependent oxidoreductase n=1 Tax=Streptomyces sp. NPDC090127 TaxID=3365953 RepID=UPI003828CF19
MEAADFGDALECRETDPSDIPGYHPLDNDRALRAWYLPEEGFIDARAWLATLDAALENLANVIRTPAGTLTALPAHGYRLDTPAGAFRAPHAVVAAGTWTTPILRTLDPDLPVVPVLAAAGTALTLVGRQVLPAVNRPITLDGHPVIGPTPKEGLWVASGTHRDGLHTSPLIATTLADTLLTGAHTAAALPGSFAAFTPCRPLITDLTRKEATAESAAHHAALAAEARMRPALTGAWPQMLADAYTELMDRAYAAMPDGYVPPPDLAPLAYEGSGSALAELAAAHLDRHSAHFG